MFHVKHLGSQYVWNVFGNRGRDENLFIVRYQLGQSLPAICVQFGKDVVQNQDWIAIVAVCSK